MIVHEESIGNNLLQTEATEVMELTVIAVVPIRATNAVPKIIIIKDIAVAITQPGKPSLATVHSRNAKGVFAVFAVRV